MIKILFKITQRYKLSYIFYLLIFINLYMVASSNEVLNAKSNNKSLFCPNSQLLSTNMLNSICWSCFFPIVILGANMQDSDKKPSMANENTICSCNDNEFGLPKIGYSLGMWQANQIIELVRHPGCLSTLNGIQLPLDNVFGSDNLKIGGANKLLGGLSNYNFYHYHIYSFPLLKILGMSVNNCLSNNYSDIDLLFFSELDPVWNNENLANMLYPESIVMKSEHANHLCAADTITNFAMNTSDNLFWCSGSWGSIYPVVGKVHNIGSMANQTSLLATRSIANLHRIGFNKQTIGTQAMCDSVISPQIIKQQYRMNMLYPIIESTSNHTIGQTTFSWGEWRNMNVTGEDAIYMLWNWRDCCNY